MLLKSKARMPRNPRANKRVWPFRDNGYGIFTCNVTDSLAVQLLIRSGGYDFANVEDDPDNHREPGDDSNTFTPATDDDEVTDPKAPEGDPEYAGTDIDPELRRDDMPDAIPDPEADPELIKQEVEDEQKAAEQADEADQEAEQEKDDVLEQAEQDAEIDDTEAETRRDSLKARYKELYGRNPRANMSDESIAEKIDEKEAQQD